ncbi:hypothetical protein Pla52o_54730 [Novipirellula galeiformis]|uniref:Uncharacterized protein n=1 Tax=Novipirellula galeiformis TaxID=2528004 RepID=A0A5C6C1Q3_9BACT|nr:hypothetical protein [Novipirellula galeiformis]TWU17134.1 hypothetical protein Pla52o_54730 [Novipirellula galeiformis]
MTIPKQSISVRNSPWVAAPVWVLFLSLVGGCQFAPKTAALRWPWSKESEPVQPERVLAVWSDTILHQPNKPGVRGFGGRIYFYEKDNTEPVEIDGGLAVYVFDADKTQPHDQRPLRKFVFTAEQFATHMSRTSLGPSYSVWLPWGEVGGPPMQLSLIARFEGSEGGTTISEPTIKLLPGVPEKKVTSEAELAKRASGNFSLIQLAGHTESSEESKDEAKSSSSSRGIKTIDLPPSFQRHLQRDRDGSQASPMPADASVSGGSNNLGGLAADANTIKGVSADSLEKLRDAQETSPLTTQVIDHRTRTQQRFQANYTDAEDEIDIRKGRWIENPPRLGQQ